MKKLYLEFVRGVAAVFVLFFHLFGLMPTAGDSKTLAFGALGPYSVVMFFILSGCVINISQTRKQRSRRSFLIDRIVRIYPQFILGLLIGLLVTYIVGSTMPSIGQLLGNFLMVSSLQGFIARSLIANSVVWSLSFEMFFYVVFLLTIGRRQKQWLWVWAAISVLALPLYYIKTDIGVVEHCLLALAFSSLWLIGYYIYQYRNSFYVDGYGAIISLGALAIFARLEIPWSQPDQAPVKYFLFAVGAIPFFRFCLQTGPTGRKMSNVALGLGFAVLSTLFLLQAAPGLGSKLSWCALTPAMLIAYAIMGRTGGRQRAGAVISGIGAVLGKYSYSIYIGHMPFLVLYAWCFPGHPLVYALLSVGSVAIVAYVFESVVQKGVNAWVKKPGNKDVKPVSPAVAVKPELVEVPAEKA